MNWRKLFRGTRDPRVTAPMISWWIIFLILCVVFLLMTLQTVVITKYFSDQMAAMISVLSIYLTFVCFVFALVIWLIWRQTVRKPLRKITDAARQVASGDFNVQIPFTKKRKKRNEIDVLIEDFNTMSRELAGNEMLKNDFISNVSHEIKAPLSLIQSYTKALRDGAYPPGQGEQYMNTVIEATERLTLMISNILKLSKLENQQIFPERCSYQLGEQLRRCALGFMEQWQEKDIDFAIDIEDVVVYQDDSLLELVWNNLLSNAIKYTEPGGRITLTARRLGDHVLVTVSDTGCGMDEETRRRVFEKFYQGDNSHASEGNGLGMALAKKIVDIADGRIWVESTPGVGTTFTVELSV